MAFYFKGGHLFQGKYRTKETQTIEGNLWQAVDDPDALWLGISFATKTQVLLNTFHCAKPNAISETEIDSGIVVKTFPVTSITATKRQR